MSGLEGDVDDQLDIVEKLNDNLEPLDEFIKAIADIDKQCLEANIEENDFTTYTYDELAYELSLVRAAVQKKLAFLDNQLVARDMTNLTPIQLEEFESVFRHFDRDGSNSLHEVEFSAALASLGLVYDDQEMRSVFNEISGRNGKVDFEGFIRFMVAVTEDTNSAEQVFQSFREVAEGKVWPSCRDYLIELREANTIHQPYVTELDLRHSLIPDELIQDLVQSMPQHLGTPAKEEDRNMAKYDYVSFMNSMIAEKATNGTHALKNGNGVRKQ